VRESWLDVKTIFTAAVELPPERRSQFLAEACADSPTLRAEVEKLLRADDDAASQFLGEPAWSVDPPPAPAPASDAFLDGRRIGPYRLIRPIGHGGMGMVFLAARADEAYQKLVAVKIVRRGMDTEDILERFQRERQTLARLDHPNIARLIDGGTTSDGLPYFVMDYVEGAPIDEYCRTARLALPERLRLFQAVCSAVHYAHQNLVVHRDLKPDNILVGTDGAPKLLDFGIAKLLTPDDPDAESGATRRHGRFLTLRYASPEQVRGEIAGTAADVYSLGVMLYELLTELRPYNLAGMAHAEAERTVCETAPTPPSVAVLREGGRAATAAAADPSGRRRAQRAARTNSRRLRGDLDRITVMAMHKSPERRYASAQQLSEDISRHLAGAPVLAQPDSAAYRAGKFIRRHKAGVAAAALVVAALVGAVAAVSWQARAARLERDRARLEARKAEQAVGFLRTMLTSANPAERGRDVTVRETLAAAADRLGVELAGDPEVEATARDALGMTYLSLGQYDEAEPHLRQALDIRRRLLGDADVNVAVSLSRFASLQTARGRFPEAEPMLREALSILERAGAAESVDAAGVYNDMGSLFQSQGRYAEAEAAHRRALAIRSAQLGETHQATATSLHNLAVSVGMRGAFAEAEPLHRKSLAVLRKIYDRDHPQTAAAIQGLATALEGLRRYDEAEPLHVEAIALRRRLLGPDHPDVAWSIYNYAFLLFQKRDLDGAVTQSRSVLALRGKTLPDTHPIVAASLNVLGRALLGQGRAQDAEPLLRDSLTLRRRTLPAGHWLLYNSESVLGECLLAEGRIAEAEPLVLVAYERLHETLGPAHERTVEALHRVVRLFEASGRPERAADYRARL
jgi:serine/threonine-protein kinase